jgi:hypothetical protein
MAVTVEDEEEQVVVLVVVLVVVEVVAAALIFTCEPDQLRMVHRAICMVLLSKAAKPIFTQPTPTPTSRV